MLRAWTLTVIAPDPAAGREFYVDAAAKRITDWRNGAAAHP